MRPEYGTVGINVLIKVISSEEKERVSTAVEGQRGGSAGVKPEAYNFAGYSSFDGKPVEMFERWCNVYIGHMD